MISRKVKKARKRLLEQLTFEKAPLSNNKGHILRERYPRPNSKDRRHSGRVEGKIIHPTMKWKEIHQEALGADEFYDSWKSYKDGWTKWYVDASRFKKRMNRKRLSDLLPEWKKPDNINKKLMKELQIRREQKKANTKV